MRKVYRLSKRVSEDVSSVVSVTSIVASERELPMSSIGAASIIGGTETVEEGSSFGVHEDVVFSSGNVSAVPVSFCGDDAGEASLCDVKSPEKPENREESKSGDKPPNMEKRSGPLFPEASEEFVPLKTPCPPRPENSPAMLPKAEESPPDPVIPENSPGKISL